MTIREICSQFDIGGEYVGCEENFTGNINNTFKVTFMREGEIKEYVLQKINKKVLKKYFYLCKMHILKKLIFAIHTKNGA